MKKILLPAVLTLLTLGAQAQMLKPARVPAAVMATFQAKFPQAKSNTWDKEGTRAVS